MAYVVMAYIVMADIVMAYALPDDVALFRVAGLVYAVRAYIVMAYIVMACIVMAYIVMAYIVLAYALPDDVALLCCRSCWRCVCARARVRCVRVRMRACTRVRHMLTETRLVLYCALSTDCRSVYPCQVFVIFKVNRDLKTLAAEEAGEHDGTPVQSAMMRGIVVAGRLQLLECIRESSKLQVLRCVGLATLGMPLAAAGVSRARGGR